MSLTLHDRLCLIVGKRSAREIAEMTGVSGETVRRYLMGQMPATDFLSALCQATGTNAEWLLNGVGLMKMEEERAYAMSNSELAELVVSLCNRIEELRLRIERLEAERNRPNELDADPLAVSIRRRR